MWFYIRENINYIDRNDLDTYFKNKKHEFGAKWIEVINKKGKNFIIVSIYRHPSKNDSEFDNYMKKTVGKITKENKLLFITGDFNYNLLNTKKDTAGELFLDTMFTYQLQPNKLCLHVNCNLISYVYISIAT